MQFATFLSRYADYNTWANERLIEALEKLTPSQFQEKTGSYFESMEGLANHTLRATMAWLKRVTHAGLAGSRFAEEVALFPNASIGSVVFASIPQFAEMRRNVDGIAVRMCAAMKDSELDPPFTYTNMVGEQKTISFGGALAHMFNHETHHRGAIALLLDKCSIENDWGNLMEVFLVK